MTLFTLNKTDKTDFKENLMKMITLSRKNTLKIPTFLILQIETQINHPTNFKENIENILPTIWNTELHKIRIRKIHADYINKLTHDKAKIPLTNTATIHVSS